MTFAGSLAFLRAAMIRTGILALVVGAGELVYQFGRLVSATGSFGAAMSLLGNLVSEVFDRMKLVAAATVVGINANWQGLKAAILSAMQGSVDALYWFGNAAVNVFQGAYNAAVSIWGNLPGAIGDFAFQAANWLVSGVEFMLNAVVDRINSFLGFLNSALAGLPAWAGGGSLEIGLLGGVDFAGVDNPFAGAAEKAGTAAADAFKAALGRKTIEPIDLGLDGTIADAEMRGSALTRTSQLMVNAAMAPLSAWAALKAAVSGTEADLAATGDAAAGAGANFDAMAGEGAGGGGGGAAKATDALGKLREELQSLQATMGMTEAQERIFTATKEAGVAATSAEGMEIAALIPQIDALTAAKERLREVAGQVKDSFKTAFTGAITGAKSFGDALKGLAQSFLDMAANSLFETIWSGGKGRGGGIGGAITKFLGFANGTASAVGGLAMVGERGPELVNLPRGSRVFDAQRTAGMMREKSAGEVYVRGGNLTLMDDGSIAAHIAVTGRRAAEAGAAGGRQAAYKRMGQTKAGR